MICVIFEVKTYIGWYGECIQVRCHWHGQYDDDLTLEPAVNIVIYKYVFTH